MGARVLRVEQPFVANVSWPAADWAFAPMGYRPAAVGRAIVPSYPPGLPLLMALAERLAGDCGPYYVVPALGGLCVWCCYLLGRRAASPAVGACAAVLLACSPAFLFHLVVPMSDVPAAALWSAALALALRGGIGRSALAGICAGLAVLVRPNLAPLAVVVAAFVAWPDSAPSSDVDPCRTLPRSWPDLGGPNRRAAWNRAGWFIAAFVPALGVIAISTGGSMAHRRAGVTAISAPHMRSATSPPTRGGTWAGWQRRRHRSIGLSVIAFLAPWLTRKSVLAPRASVLFLTFTLVVAASYLPYSVFDEWWYLRFFLPALPLILVSMSASIFRLLAYLAPAARVWAFLALGTLLVSHELRFAIDAGLMRLQPNERRYVAVARFIEASTPPNAVFLTLQHGGSVRHYADRLTVRFDRVSTGLDEALASLERAGLRPFILLEDWEEPQFKDQFGASSTVGRLAWRPLARLSEPGGVNIYDPKQAHDAAAHELAVIPPPGPCDCRHY